MKINFKPFVHKIKLRTWVALGIIIVLAPLAFAAAYGILGALGGSNATLAGWWKFDEGTDNTCSGGTNDTCDSSGNAADGALSGATWQTEDKCASGKCLYFDGTNDLVSLPSNFFDAHSTGAICTWMKWNVSADAGGEYHLVSYADGASTDYKINFYISDANTDDANLVFYLRENGLANDLVVKSSNGAIARNRWQHVCANQDGSNGVKLYINGSEISTTTTADGTATANDWFDDIAANAENATIGATIDNSAGEYFNGFIDEVKVFSSSLSDSQIKAEYAGGAAVLGDSFDSNDFLNDGLVGYWPFDESSGNASDKSGNGTTLTNNSSTPYTAGKFGNAIEPVGTADYFEAADNAALSITSSLTLAAWINNDDTTGSQNIIGKWDGTNNSYMLALEGDELRMYIDSANDYQTTTSANLGSNSFVHVAGVYDANAQTVKLYVNGVEQASTTTGTIPSSIGDDAGEFVVGADDSPANFFDGHIDEARVYNRTLSPFEVKDLYNWAPGPSGHWKFDENTGSTAFDSSGNGFNATLYGNTRYTTGKFGSATSYDGDNTAGTHAAVVTNALDGFGQGTICTWVKPYDTGDAAQNFIAISDDDNGVHNNYVTLGFVPSTNALFAEIEDNNVTTLIGAPNTTITPNQWAHFCFSVDEDSNQFYLNGTLQSATYSSGNSSTTTWFDDINVGDTIISFGCREASFVSPSNCSGDTVMFEGELDDIRIYNYARTPQQIVEDMNAGHPTGGSPIGTATSYWNFDELSGTSAFDSNATNNNTLTLSSASWTTSGKYNGAWNGTGSVWLTRADDDDFDFVASQDFSLSMWVKSDSATNPGADQFLIAKQVATNNPGYRMRFNTSGQIVCEIDDDTSSFPEDSATTTTDYYDGNWHHVICVRDITGAALNLYIDGLLSAADTSLSATGDLSNATSLRIGDDDGDATNSFAGDIDEVKIFSSALTADQVKIVYSANSAVNFGTGYNDNTNIVDGAGAAPVGYWPMDENTGTTSVADKSNNNTTLSMNGSMTNDDWVAGKFGSALDFDGSNDFLRASDPAVLDMGTSNFTISTWVWRDTATTVDQIVDKRSTGDGTSCSGSTDIGYDFLIWDTDQLSMAICDGTNGWEMFSSPGVVTTGTWHHVAAVVNRSSLSSSQLFLDGVQISNTKINGGSDPPAGNSITNTHDFIIGASISNDYPWDGRLDNVKIYNYAQTAAQVAYDYNRGAPLFWYKMDDNVSGNGQTIVNNAKNASGQATGINGTTDDGANNTGMDCTVAGKRNQACDLDGIDDFIQVSSPGLPTGDFTYTMWINPDVAENTLLMASDGSGGNEFLLTIDSTDSNKLKTFLNGGSADVTSSQSISTNTWTHVAVTRAGSTITLYINGLTEGTGSNGTALGFSTCALLIGVDADATCTGTLGEYFDGTVDDVRIYGYGLSATQIWQVMNEGAIRFGPDEGSP